MTRNILNNRLNNVQLLSLLIFVVGNVATFGQGSIADGYYYISAYNSHSNTSQVNNFYLVPSAGTSDGKPTSAPITLFYDGESQPYLTTFKTQADENSIWQIKWVKTEDGYDYYNIIHSVDGRYLTHNYSITSEVIGLRVHLQATPDEDNSLFRFSATSPYNIIPKTVAATETKNALNPYGGNKNYYNGNGNNAKINNTDTPIGGLIGLYVGSDNNSKWYLDADCPNPKILFDEPTGRLSLSSVLADATIYYTLNGTNPVVGSSAVYDGTPLDLSGDDVTKQIRAIAVVDRLANSKVAILNLPVYAPPVIKYVAGKLYISLADATTTPSIYYTDDGTTPTTSSMLYTGPLVPEDGKTYKAIAVKRGTVDQSAVASYLFHIETVSESSQIDNMTGNYLLSEGFNQTASIGTKDNPFRGTINGQLITLSGLTHPLVAYADGAIIKNVILDNVSIDANANGNAGAICAEAVGATRIYNCGVLVKDGNSTVTGTNNVGSIVGLLSGTSRVVNCYSFADVRGGTETGGIVGNNNYASKTGDIRTMVMNCMFYGTISGNSISPVYGGQEISNDNTRRLNNYNYFLGDNIPVNSITKANGALSVEQRFLTRFEFYRLLLNSNRELACCYVNGNDAESRLQMAKWVLDTSIAPYPILKLQDKYASVINYDPSAAPSTTEPVKNLSVSLSGSGITTTSLILPITDKDPDHFNYNHHKVQLPYFNDVGTGNYTDNRVVTGWEITVTGGSGNFTTNTYDAPDYNFADRKCTEKDNYATSGRVFAQGAYFDVPDGVSSITLSPHWARCTYLSDTYYDNYDYNNDRGVTDFGKRYSNGKFQGQTVHTSFEDALRQLDYAYGRTATSSVYDYAVVLVGNCHRYGTPKINTNDTNPFTLMSADLDKDNEPDFTMIYSHNGRDWVPPIRFDFINVMSHNLAQKSTSSGIRLTALFYPRGWFEVTNTCLIHFLEFEYDRSSKNMAPLILEGGVYEQFVSTHEGQATKTSYIHLGSNAWFKEFCNGTHVGRLLQTNHNPISVTGGQYEKFYLTGTFRPDVNSVVDNAECYIDGGKFGEVAGAGQEQVKGSVTWLINHADIDYFYGGGINASKPITGDISVTIENSNVGVYCGGPKFGNMQTGKIVTTKANGTRFGTFYGAGYGGTSFYRQQIDDKTYKYNTDLWQSWAASYVKGAYHDTESNGIAVNFEYEFFDGAENFTVARLYVNYATLSLAKTNDVFTTLKDCKITNNFYGGGNLGMVNGTITSVLEDCEINNNVYGSGFSATPPTVDVMDMTGANGAFITEPYYNTNTGSYQKAVLPDVQTYIWSSKGSDSATITDDADGHWIYTTEDLTTLGQVNNAVLTIKGSTTVGGSVYGGGEASAVEGSVTVNMQDGTVADDLYGGGALADTNTKGGTTTTTVNLTGGTVSRNVYGGGMGDAGHEPTVGGNITVNLNENVPDTGVRGCVIGGSIFGCNNINGTPLAGVKVHVFKTQNAAATQITNAGSITNAKQTGEYDIHAVYGGGNQAAYIPTDLANGKTEVIIDGCELTSIEEVYGGGNAASTPGTSVTVNGTFEVNEVFGGGNGKDPISPSVPNPGANVGYLAYPDEADYDTRNNTDTEKGEVYVYGSGRASVDVYGGTIHAVYGGSNTKGNVRHIAVAMLEDLDMCDFRVDEAYGGGKRAPMDGEALLDMKCIPGMNYAYGGAKNADVNGRVTLNITNGTFKQVFGGNNEGGCIYGPITVNIEETGCRPIIIGELYGGGNRAAYSVYGYKKVTVGSGDEAVTEWLPRESADDQGTGPDAPYDDPVVNVRSFTSIGDVYGAGYGEKAVMVGNAHVNINVVKDAATEAQNKPSADYAGGTMTIDGREVVLPSHHKGEIGAVNNVFGAGNKARLIGDTYVNIATEATTTFNTITGAAATKPVSGADIRGNVYGGGNRADMTGKTNVVVGLQAQ